MVVKNALIRLPMKDVQYNVLHSICNHSIGFIIRYITSLTQYLTPRAYHRIPLIWGFIPLNKSFIDQACSVKLAGYPAILTSRLVNNLFIIIWQAIFTVRFRGIFFPSREIQIEQNTKSFFKKRNLIFSSQQYNYSKRILLLHVKGYVSKFADGRRMLRKNINQAEKCPIVQRKDATTY